LIVRILKGSRGTQIGKSRIIYGGRIKMAKSTYRDAMVILQIGQLWTTSGASKAFNWLWSDQFIPDYAAFVEKYPRGSEGWHNAFLLLKHYETIGALWKHGLIYEELLFDTWGSPSCGTGSRDSFLARGKEPASPVMARTLKQWQRAEAMIAGEGNIRRSRKERVRRRS
jgi:hypothetical protein